MIKFLSVNVTLLTIRLDGKRKRHQLYEQQLVDCDNHPTLFYVALKRLMQSCIYINCQCSHTISS